MPGPVAEAHSDAEMECASCHVRFARNSQRDLCLGCHEEIATDIATGTGFHGLSPDVGATEECADCHSDHLGRDADILGLDVKSFDHDLTDFPLRGGHADVECDGCHLPTLTYHDADTECVGCHLEDDQHRGNLGEACGDCHSEADWADAHFDHEAVTDYALTGKHEALTCVSCHVDEQYLETPDQCVDCHRDDDSHMGHNGTECASCHTPAAWEDVIFDHFATSGFALEAGHSDLACDSCHVGDKSVNKPPTECVGCHRDDDAHDGINGEACGDCHRVTDWKDVSFDHARDADFALLGAHAGLACVDCHTVPVEVSRPGTACIDCHADDDPHEAQLGEDCGRCHNETDFAVDVRFDHDLTSFPLLGRHDEVVCEDCHASHAFLDAPEQCADCHRDDDVHDRRLGSDCALCHNPNDWLLWSFDHDAQTSFPLDGAHSDLDCLACHRERGDTVAALSSSCGSCHRRDDVHKGEFGQNCAQCHLTESFATLRDTP